MRVHVQQEGHVEGPHQRKAQHRVGGGAQQAGAGLRASGGEWEYQRGEATKEQKHRTENRPNQLKSKKRYFQNVITL